MFRLIVILFTLFIGFRLLLHFFVQLVNFISGNEKIFKNYNKAYNHKNNHKNLIHDLAKCDYCGVYIIKEDIISYNGQIFCCKEHAQQV